MKKNILKKCMRVFVFFVTCFFLINCSTTAFSQSLRQFIDLASEQGQLVIIAGDLKIISTKNLTRVAITDPGVADVVESKKSEILILGKTPGKTTVFIWDDYGKRSIEVRVFSEDLDLVESRIRALLKSANVKNLDFKKNNLEGKIIISGELDEYKKGKFDEIVEPFSQSIVSLVRDREKIELIEIDVEIAELNVSATEDIGVEWGTSTCSDTLSLNGYAAYQESLPTFGGNTLEDFFKIGDLHRNTSLQAKINALITRGEGKILSRPKIITKSGEEANFNVGGQVPVSTTTTSDGGNVTENVEFKDYGVQLNIVATVRENDKIDIDLKVDVTDVDNTYKVDNNFAYVTRTADTKLLLDNMQTIVIAGFIKDSKTEAIRKVPFLGDVPFFGALFRSKTIDPNKQTELFITLTPKIISTNRPEPLVQEQLDVAEEKVIFIEHKPKSTARETFRSISVPGNMAGYVQSVQKKIARNLIYPREAKKLNLQGAVSLELILLQNGALLSSSIQQSSGYPVLDQAALNTTQRFSPYGRFPSDVRAKEIKVTIPIVYRLNMN